MNEQELQTMLHDVSTQYAEGAITLREMLNWICYKVPQEEVAEFLHQFDEEVGSDIY